MSYLFLVDRILRGLVRYVSGRVERLPEHCLIIQAALLALKLLGFTVLQFVECHEALVDLAIILSDLPALFLQIKER